MTGFTRDELYGNSVGMIFHQGSRDQLVEALKTQGRATLSFSQRLITRTGDFIPVLMSRASGGIGAAGERSTALVLGDLSQQANREEVLGTPSERLGAPQRARGAITRALMTDKTGSVLLGRVSRLL